MECLVKGTGMNTAIARIVPIPRVAVYGKGGGRKGRVMLLYMRWCTDFLVKIHVTVKFTVYFLTICYNLLELRAAVLI